MVNLHERIDDGTAQLHRSQQQQKMAGHKSQLDEETVPEQLSQQREIIQKGRSTFDGQERFAK